MPKPTHKLTIKCPNPATYSLPFVTSQPRVCKQIDVAAACENLEIEEDSPTPSLVMSVVRYIMQDFFAIAHRTGLYNRQKGLWESLGRVEYIEAFRLQQGLFSKKDLPFFQLHFNDNKGRLLLFAQVAEEGAMTGDDLDYRQKESVKSFLSKADKLRAAKGGLFGMFLVYPKPFPENVLRMIEKMTGASDPVGKFESVLPEPLLVPIDLLQMETTLLQTKNESEAVQLIHPNLGARGRTIHRVAVPAEVGLLAGHDDISD
jgi:hypothetical protein